MRQTVARCQIQGSSIEKWKGIKKTIVVNMLYIFKITKIYSNMTKPLRTTRTITEEKKRETHTHTQTRKEIFFFQILCRLQYEISLAEHTSLYTCILVDGKIFFLFLFSFFGSHLLFHSFWVLSWWNETNRIHVVHLYHWKRQAKGRT